MDSTITSLQNARIKRLNRLRTRAGREQQQRFTIDGRREVRRALDGDWRFLEIYFCSQRCDNEDQQLIADLVADGAEQIEVTPDVMDKISYGQRTLPLIAVARIPDARTVAALSISSDSLILVLEAIEKPGNLGAIIRTADAAGISAVLLADSQCDIFNPNAIRASAGALFHLPIIHDDCANILQWMQANKFNIFATKIDACCHYTEVDLAGRTCIVLGTEATGLSDKWNSTNSQAIAVPMEGIGDSLNVSITAAIMAFESRRQRGLGKTDQESGIQPNT